MKKNKNPLFLPKYKEWMITGTMSNLGLCLCWLWPEETVVDEFIEMVTPTHKDLKKLAKENCATVYWGAGIPGEGGCVGQFTTLRQTLVLLMAALNDEL